MMRMEGTTAIPASVLQRRGLNASAAERWGCSPVQPNSIGDRPTLCLDTNMPSDGNPRACTPLSLHTAVNRREIDPARQVFKTVRRGVWSTRVRFGTEAVFSNRAAGFVVRCGVVYITCTSSTNASNARSLETAFERWDQRTVSDGLAADAEADQNVQLQGSRI